MAYGFFGSENVFFAKVKKKRLSALRCVLHTEQVQHLECCDVDE